MLNPSCIILTSQRIESKQGKSSSGFAILFCSIPSVWSDGAKVLGKLPVLGRPTNLDSSRARAYCACSRCEQGLFGHFFSNLSFLFTFSLSLGDSPI